MKKLIPYPLIDTAEQPQINSNLSALGNYIKHDLAITCQFLRLYDDNQATFLNYRKETERLLHWSWLIAKKSILKLRREDIENFIKFCQKPLKSWIGIKTVSRFINKNSKRVPNPEWRPFVATISKAEVNKGNKPRKDEYIPSQQSIKTTFVILGSFYTYLINEKLTEINPVLQIRQKSKFLRKQQGAPKVPRLSEVQWKCLIDTTRKLSDKNPDRHQRTLFIITAMYLMYLRISEFVATSRWTPIMGHFYKDSNDNWWFITVGKGNKERHVTVSKGMVSALKTWRKHLGLSLLPSPQDQFPLLPKNKGKGAVTSIRMLRHLIQECFNATTQELLKKGEQDEAGTMAMATVHWLRHTGISDDINKYGRPILHVRDDAVTQALRLRTVTTMLFYANGILQEKINKFKKLIEVTLR